MTEYIFNDAAATAELTRLRLLESVFDEKTRHWLLSTGPLAGRRCLEVGAGAGSIAEWMAYEVGPLGSVMAIDADTRFLGRLASTVELVEGHLGVIAAPVESFDLVHARYVLIHNADERGVLEAMLRALKPGGLLVLEEPDFSATSALCGPAPLRGAFEKVKRAIHTTFSKRGMRSDFGRLLPDLLLEAGCGLVTLEYDSPAAPGGSELAEMMRLSTLALEDKYLLTGEVTPADISNYSEFAAARDCWAIYYATVRVVARKNA